MKRAYILLLFVAALSVQSCSDKGKPSNSNPAALLKTEGQKAMAANLRNVADGTLYTLEYDQPYFIDEIMAGGGAKSSESLLSAVLPHLVNLPSSVTGGNAEYGCSAFSVKSPEGDVLVGRNFDYRFTSSSNVLVHNTLSGVHRSMGISAMPFLSREAYVAGALSDGKTDISIPVAASIYCCMDGMNDAGLFICVLSLRGGGAVQHAEGKSNIVPSLAIRLVLDSCTCIEDAVKLFRSHNFFADGEKSDYNYHFLIADTSGKSVVVEYWRPGESAPVANPGEKDWTLSVLNEDHVTNFYLSESWQNLGGGQDRYNRLDSTMTAESRIMTEDECMDLLNAVHTDLNSEGGEVTSNTQWSVVYNLTQKTATVCAAKNYSDKIHFNL